MPLDIPFSDFSISQWIKQCIKNIGNLKRQNVVLGGHLGLAGHWPGGDALAFPEIEDPDFSVRRSGEQHLRVVVEKAGGHQGKAAGHAAAQTSGRQVAFQVRARLDVVEHQETWYNEKKFYICCGGYGCCILLKFVKEKIMRYGNWSYFSTWIQKLSKEK